MQEITLELSSTVLAVQRFISMSWSSDNTELDCLCLVNGMICKNDKEPVIRLVPQAMVYKVFLSSYRMFHTNCCIAMVTIILFSWPPFEV